MTSRTPPESVCKSPDVTMDDLPILRETIEMFLKKCPQNPHLQVLYKSLSAVTREKNPNYIWRLLVKDDCPEYTGEGYNRSLIEKPLNSLQDLHDDSGYIGKIIIRWRIRINK